LTGTGQAAPERDTGTLEKMIVANGHLTLDLDLDRVEAKDSRSDHPDPTRLQFDVDGNAFFSVLVFNHELRGPQPGTLGLVPVSFPSLPAKLNESYRQLVLEQTAWGEAYELVIRDGRTGFVFFNIEGQQLAYGADERSFNITRGRVLLSPEFAAALGRSADAGAVVGKLSFIGTLQPVEVTQVVNGEVRAHDLPAIRTPEDGAVPGPDVVIGDLTGLAQFGSNGTQVGLAMGTDSCNFGTENVHWFTPPDNDHPVIPQNLYRMSGGAANDERFEQIGQSSALHAFFALAQNTCNLGCNNVSGTNLGSGCSNPYTASTGSGPMLGSRGWINPYTGAFPNGTTGPNPNDHAGHVHNGTSHRILTESNDLLPSANQGATYYAEAQEVTPHEYAWCQAHPGECNMNNNVSYRRYNVAGTTTFSFTPVGTTVRAQPAIDAWTGATLVNIQPDPANDGVGIVGYKVTNPSAGVWHYEYAIYNQNLDRAINSFTVPIGNGALLTNIGFHAPPQHPGWANDGTVGGAGYSNFAWSQTTQAGTLNWSAETLAQNPNANAIRWGTLYNFRFDANRPPQTVNATIGFFKTGAPITVQIQTPSPAAVVNATVSGRVTAANGRAISNVWVVMSDGTTMWVALTNQFGFYSFTNVTGGNYTFTVASKRYTFNPQTVPVTGNIANLNFTALP
jgi:hypothetical protein